MFSLFFLNKYKPFIKYNDVFCLVCRQATSWIPRLRIQI